MNPPGSQGGQMRKLGLRRLGFAARLAVCCAAASILPVMVPRAPLHAGRVEALDCESRTSSPKAMTGWSYLSSELEWRTVDQPELYPCVQVRFARIGHHDNTAFKIAGTIDYIDGTARRFTDGSWYYVPRRNLTNPNLVSDIAVDGGRVGVMKGRVVDLEVTEGKLR
jgi:hypothetical protein